MAEDQVIQDKIKKVEELKKLGIDLYPYTFDQKNHASEIIDRYKHLKSEEKTADTVKVAGRVMQMRRMGKATFGHLQDNTGKIQLFFKQDDLGEEKYNLVKFVDLGDLIGAEGKVFKTKTGETSIWLADFKILCKGIRPMPEKFHGLKDDELRYRHRELDLIVNPEVKEIFVKRTKIINAIKEFMDLKGFMDIQTPVLQCVYGGAEARPFKTHINAWDLDLYLQISPELFLKRLIVGGFEKVYTICKNFRNEGVDKTHNPEFTMMEFYQSYVDYNEMMKLTEELYNHIAQKILGTSVIEYEGKKIDLKAPWERLTVKDSLKKYAKIEVDNLDDKKLKDLLKKHKIEHDDDIVRGRMIMLLFEELVEEHLIQPVFITDYPKEASPLCKPKRGDPNLIEKVEPYINGWEVGNGYSELNDPLIQRALLEEQARKLRAGEQEAHPMDEEFVQAIEIGMPPTGGMGIGIDRMIILLTGASSLREVLLFPIMRPEEKEN